MIKNVLCSINDIATGPIVALVLFLFVFAGAIVVALAMKSSEAAARCRMPLDDASLPGEGERT